MDQFRLVSDYRPSGDQPEAITGLVNGVNWGLREQTLLGVTGSGKTFTMASVIEKLNRPTLVLAHNQTLAAQLCSEFREFFPNNAVEIGLLDHIVVADDDYVSMAQAGCYRAQECCTMLYQEVTGWTNSD